MTIRISTGSLLAVLTDLLRTADHDADADVMDAVLLHSTTGHYGAEPGKVELLAGISSDRHVAGHTYVNCAGTLRRPTLWSIRDTAAVLAVFKAARGKDPHNLHAVEISVDAGEVQIREDPNLIDEGVSLRFGERDLDPFPARTLYRVLDSDLPTTITRPEAAGGGFLDATPRTDYSPPVLEPFMRVGRRRGAPLRLFRGHQHRPVLVQIGDTYRGLLMPWRPTETGGDDQRPDADIHTPDLTHWAERTADVSTDGGQTWTQLEFVELDDGDADPDRTEPLS